MDGSQDSPQRDAVLPTLEAAAAPAPPVRLARIGLRFTGVSLATSESLRLAEAHALARDAVHSRLSTPAILAALRALDLPTLSVYSTVRDRREYLLRPDLGRQLGADSEALLRSRARNDPAGPPVLAVLIADGLSALAADRHAIPVLRQLLPGLGISLPGSHAAHEETWRLAPIVVAENARVALGDVVAGALGADAVLVLLGERPGMSSPDSLGAYITWRPRSNTTDAERNCVSNIRGEGLGSSAAAQAIAWYLNQGRRTGATGVSIRASDKRTVLAASADPARSLDIS